jgi:cell wall-associated NlpC family hydrolase
MKEGILRFDGITANIVTAAVFSIALIFSGCSPSVRYTREQPSHSTVTSSQSTQTPPQNQSDPAPKYGSGDSQSKLVQAAESYLGTPYKYGAMGRNAVDCSGYVGLVYQEVYGVNLPRTSSKMWKKGKALPLSAARPGDLCFFSMSGKKGRIDHVGIYMGNNRFIHASTSGGVMYSGLNDNYLTKRFAGIRRVL